MNYRAYFDAYDIITVYMGLNFYQGQSEYFYFRHQDEMIKLYPYQRYLENNYQVYKLKINHSFTIGEEYYLYTDQARKTLIHYRMIVKSQEFNQEYSYDQALGSIVSNDQTDFRLFAPTAMMVSLELDGKLYPMEKTKGIYHISFSQNLHGYKYRYLVRVNGSIHYSNDPYTLAVYGNDEYSVVIDYSSINCVEAKEKLGIKDAIIYETSIFDISKDIKFKNLYPSKFKALAYSNNNQILSYLKDLNFTHLQLMPISTCASIDIYNPSLFYNWGYDVNLFGALNNLYATKYDGITAVKEFAMMINNLHQSQIQVTLDVVFNHVYDYRQSALNLTCPYYYFQYHSDYSLSNGSYCGNDFDSSQKMSEKLITDILERYVKYFKIDGFRFDLMGILDLRVINRIHQKLKAINPQILIYGEGWEMPCALKFDYQAIMYHQAQMEVAFFSDYYRETIFNLCAGYPVEMNTVLDVLQGSTSFKFTDSYKSLNYLQSHDNYTMRDRLSLLIKDSSLFPRLKMMYTLLILSQGPIFIHGGQEFYNTKYMVENSYNSGNEINTFSFSQMIENRESIEFFKKLIKLRRSLTEKLTVNLIGDKLIEFKNKDYQIIVNLNDFQIEINSLNCN